MNKLMTITTMKTNQFQILLTITLAIVISIGSAQATFAANLQIDDSTEAQVTNAHDPFWDAGAVVSNGTPFPPSLAGIVTIPGEAGTFHGVWHAAAGTPGSGVIYFTDACTGKVAT